MEKKVLECIIGMNRVISCIAAGNNVTEGDKKLLAMIGEQLNALLEEEIEPNEPIEIEVTRYLNMLGIPKNVMGYRFIRSAIILRFEKAEMESITKVIYPAVAKEFCTTPARVERAIRNAIDISWKRESCLERQKLFKASDPKKARPTNSEFIDTIVDELRMKHL